MLQQSNRNKARAQANKVAVRANEVFIWFTGAVWQFYRAVLAGALWCEDELCRKQIADERTFNIADFAGPTELVIPEHTRDAFFQLWCDLRTNVPKDRNWVRHHATALQPRTSFGYLVRAFANRVQALASQ